MDLCVSYVAFEPRLPVTFGSGDGEKGWALKNSKEEYSDSTEDWFGSEGLVYRIFEDLAGWSAGDAEVAAQIGALEAIARTNIRKTVKYYVNDIRLLYYVQSNLFIVATKYSAHPKKLSWAQNLLPVKE